MNNESSYTPQEQQRPIERPYNGWLVSNNILKRTCSIMGHAILGNLLIYAVFIVLFALFGIGALIAS